MIKIGDIVLLEPWVAATDLLVTMAGLWCFAYVLKFNRKITNQRLLKGWSLFFLLQAFSFLLGGLAHALYRYTRNVLYLLSWYTNIVSVYAFENGILSSKACVKKTFYSWLIALKMLAALTFVSVLRHVNYAIVNVLLSVPLIAVLNQKVRLIHFDHKDGHNFLIGFLLFILGGLSFGMKIEVAGLNASILSHILLFAGFLFFGRGCAGLISRYSKLSSAQKDTSMIEHSL